MLVVGLTGGIGAGKSTVAKLFEQHGVAILDADVAARAVTTPDSPAFTSIVKHFGESIVLPSGLLDRNKLRDIIFSDPKQRLWLENLLHPLIRDHMRNELHHIKTPYCIAVIPLLLEVEFYSFINRILVVDAPEDMQVERVMTRDQTPKTAVDAILHSQASRKDRRAKAHDIITNDKNLAHLLPQVEKLHKQYLEMAKTP